MRGFPLLLLMLYLLALLQRNELLKYGLVLAINFLLIYTGFGVFMGALTIAFFALACTWSLRGTSTMPIAVPAAGLLIASISFASFFFHYKFQTAVDCFEFPYHRLVDYPWFVALMFSTFAGLRSPIVLVTVLGAILLLFAVYILGFELKRVAHDSDSTPLTIAILLSFSLLFAVNTAIGRVCLGLPAPAQSSRYTTLLIPAFLAMYFYLLAVPNKKARETGLIVLVLILIPGHAHLPSHAPFFADRKIAWANCYKRTESIADCDSATAFKIYPDPEATGLKQKLDYLKRNKLNLFAE